MKTDLLKAVRTARASGVVQKNWFGEECHPSDELFS